MKMGAAPALSIGVGLGLIFLGFGLREYLPNIQDRDFHRTVAEATEAEANKLPAAKKRLERAKEIVQEKANDWQEVVAARTPPNSLAAGGIDMSVNAWQLVVDTPKFRNSIQNAVNRQVKTGGVEVLNGPRVPSPDMNGSTIVANYFNYPAIPFPVVIFDFGTITVRGTYAQIMENVRSWSDMPNYLAVADGLAINGTAPILTGTYNLSMVGYIRGDKIFPTVPEGGAAPAAGGAAGGGGGGGGRRAN